MKKILLIITIILFSYQNGISQTNPNLDITSKDYKKISKKLDLKIINRGFDGGLVVVSVNSSAVENYTFNARSYKLLWDEAFFEMGLDVGTEKIDDDGNTVTNADYYIEVGKGGYSGKIYRIGSKNELMLSFNTKEKMNIDYVEGKTSKRGTEFKNYVKVVYNEILKTIK